MPLYPLGLGLPPVSSSALLNSSLLSTLLPISHVCSTDSPLRPLADAARVVRFLSFHPSTLTFSSHLSSHLTHVFPPFLILRSTLFLISPQLTPLRSSRLSPHVPPYVITLLHFSLCTSLLASPPLTPLMPLRFASCRAFINMSIASDNYQKKTDTKSFLPFSSLILTHAPSLRLHHRTITRAP